MTRTCHNADLTAHFDNAAGLFSALANEKRLLILNMLINQEISVGELARHAKLSQSALSQHLSKLRALDLVSTRRDAQTIYYTVSSPRIEPIISTLSKLYQQEPVS